MQARLPLFAAALALCAAPLGACSMMGMGFDKYDGRWVANVPPSGNCCPSRVVVDIDGHALTGSVEDCSGVTGITGKVQDSGQASLNGGGGHGSAQFGGVNFTASMPGDRCGRAVVGNRGG